MTGHAPAHRDGHLGVDFVQIPSAEYRKLKQMKARLWELMDRLNNEIEEYQKISGGFSDDYELLAARCTLPDLRRVAGIE